VSISLPKAAQVIESLRPLVNLVMPETAVLLLSVCLILLLVLDMVGKIEGNLFRESPFTPDRWSRTQPATAAACHGCSVVHAAACCTAVAAPANAGHTLL